VAKQGTAPAAVSGLTALATMGVAAMPLSEDEQRILADIERQFYEEDPKLAREVSRTSVYSHAGRQLKWAIAGIVVGLVLMVVLIALQVVWASLIAGFGMAFVCAVWAWYSFRRMTAAGINDLRRRSRTLFPKGISGEDLKRRFQREE